MVRIQQIESLDHPELAPYRTLKRPLEHEQQRIFVAEGEKIVRRLLLTDFKIVSVLATAGWFQELKESLDLRPEEIDVFVGEKALLEELTGYAMWQGIQAVAHIPQALTLDQVLHSSSRPYFLAAVDGLNNAENLGVVVRNCGAFGVQALLVGEAAASPYLRRAVRSSMGVVFHLPIVQSQNLAETLRELRKRKIRCLAAHPQPEAVSLDQTCFTGDCCIVFGNEAHGISREVVKACDEAVAIPMVRGVDSLNVGSAAAVFLYEVARQRKTRLFE